MYKKFNYLILTRIFQENSKIIIRLLEIKISNNNFIQFNSNTLKKEKEIKWVINFYIKVNNYFNKAQAKSRLKLCLKKDKICLSFLHQKEGKNLLYHLRHITIEIYYGK